MIGGFQIGSVAGMDITSLSKQYKVRTLSERDIPDVLALCGKNSLYYRYCPPFVSEKSIAADMKALPPGKDASDKYYIGYYDGDRLTAIMDLIMAFPNDKTAFIGFFMMETDLQGRGLGSSIIGELCACLPRFGISAVRLGWAKGNPQSEHFWHKNGFAETGATYDTGGYTVVVAQREL